MNITIDQIISSIENYISNSLNISKERILSDKEISSFGLSSLDTISMLLYLEEEFNVMLPSDLSIPIKTINDVATAISNAIEERDKRNIAIEEAEYHIFEKEGF